MSSFPVLSGLGVLSKEVFSFPTRDAFPAAGKAGEFYVDEATDTVYYWNPNDMAFVVISGQGEGGGVTDHGDLTGLGDDDHPQYLNNNRGDVRYAQIAHTHPYDAAGTAVQVVAAHEQAANPHPIYLTQAEADAIYASLANQPETIRDTIGATLVAGSNVTITVDDNANTITISAAGEGGGATLADGSYGDVTVSGSGTVITINNAAVAIANLENIATASFLGRATASTGEVEVLTAAQARAVLNVEDGATADMSGGEIVNAINLQLGGTTWQGGGGGGGAALIVQRADTTVVGAAATVDFSSDFDVTEAPTGEANVAIGATIARLASPALSGTPSAPTAPAGTNTTQIATTAHVFAERANAATLSNKTLAAPTISGVATYDGAEIITPNAIPALAVDVSKKLNTKSISADSTFTFSTTPVANTWFGLLVTNTDSNPHIITFPSSFDVGAQAAKTTCPISASGKVWLIWRYTGSGYDLFGVPGYLSKFDATAAPTFNDDIADGFGPGSLWLNATSNLAYICEDNASGAAVWHLLNGSGAALADGDKGDITVSSSGTVWTIDNAVVTLAKLANIATARVMGRSTSGSGVPEELTLSQVLDMIGSAAQGDILYRGASTWARLAAGTNGHFLQSQGAGANPQWAAVSSGSLTDGDKGDITVSGGGAAWAIDNGAVTLAKMANIATDTLIGRDSASTGVPEAISVGGGIEFSGSGGIRTTAFTGDVTKTAGGTALTIANDAVTYAKMQNVSATDRLLGRSSSGAGDVEEITCTAAGRALLDDADAAAQRTTLSAAARTQTGLEVSVFIGTVTDGTVKLLVNSSGAKTITRITTKSDSGTCTVTGKINGTNLGGTANSASSTEQSQTHSSANAIAAGDDFDIAISSNSSCVGLIVTIEYSKALA